VREHHDRCAKVRGCVIPVFDDAGMTIEGRLHDPALHAAAAAVHDADFGEACIGGGIDILFDDRRYIPWRERVKINLRLDRNANGIRFTPQTSFCKLPLRPF
jgi:hypothetical protein